MERKNRERIGILLHKHDGTYVIFDIIIAFSGREGFFAYIFYETNFRKIVFNLQITTFVTYAAIFTSTD